MEPISAPALLTSVSITLALVFTVLLILMLASLGLFALAPSTPVQPTSTPRFTAPSLSVLKVFAVPEDLQVTKETKELIQGNKYPLLYRSSE